MSGLGKPPSCHLQECWLESDITQWSAVGVSFTVGHQGPPWSPLELKMYPELCPGWETERVWFDGSAVERWRFSIFLIVSSISFVCDLFQAWALPVLYSLKTDRSFTSLEVSVFSKKMLFFSLWTSHLCALFHCYYPDFFSSYGILFMNKDKKKKYEPPVPTRVGKKKKKTKGPDAASKLPLGKHSASPAELQPLHSWGSTELFSRAALVEIATTMPNVILFLIKETY